MSVTEMQERLDPHDDWDRIVDELRSLLRDDELDELSDPVESIQFTFNDRDVSLTPTQAVITTSSGIREEQITISPLTTVRVGTEELEYEEGAGKTHYEEPVKVRIDKDDPEELENRIIVFEGKGDNNITLKQHEERLVKTYRWE